MNRLDRALGILLHLRQGKTVAAAELARRFEVSTRTIYRDIELLSQVGVPVYAELGRDGGFRLADGYFLPPVMFSIEEATTLALGLQLLRRLRVTPFVTAIDTAERKLLAATPDRLRALLSDLPGVIGFERVPPDLLHPEPDDPVGEPRAGANGAESEVVGVFLRAIFQRCRVRFSYLSPYVGKPADGEARPLGLIWDRDRWYLVAQPLGRRPEPWLFRADRVRQITLGEPLDEPGERFDVETLLGRAWLKSAMDQWRAETPVVIRLTAAQAATLARDWYYRHAQFEPQPAGSTIMTVGEMNQRVIFDLLRWLGPGAELLEPRAWRSALRDELRALAAAHGDEASRDHSQVVE